MDYQRYRHCTGCNAQMDVFAVGNCNTCRQIAAMEKLSSSMTSNRFFSPTRILPPVVIPENLPPGYTIGLPPIERKIMSPEEFEKFCAKNVERLKERMRRDKERKQQYTFIACVAAVLTVAWIISRL